MSRRERTIKTTILEELPEGRRVLHVEVYHITGRGYYANANVKTIKRPRMEGGYGAIEFMPFSAATAKLLDAARFNAATLARLEVPAELLQRLEAETLEKNAETAERVRR